MPNSPAHLTGWTLEQLAEGSLPSAESTRATEHLQRCARCSSEFEAYRVLAASLAELPRFAPSPDFADAVMARVRMAPAADPFYAKLVSSLPQTRRGWSMLVAAAVAPALPVILLVGWLLSQPLVTAGALWQWGSAQVLDGSRLVLASLTEWSASVGLLSAAQGLVESVQAVPLVTLMVVVAVLAVAIPLSAWALVRLVRTPMGNVTYAN